MKKRGAFGVFFLSLITLGIYEVVWLYKTTCEMRNLNENIPHFSQLFFPVVSLLWLQKFCAGLEGVTKGNLSKTKAWHLINLFGLGKAIIQAKLNKVAS